MSVEENKKLVLRVLETLNEGGPTFIAKAHEFYSDDIVLHDAHSHDIQGFHDYVEQHVRHLFQVFPDARVDLDDIIAEGDKVVGRMTITGTQTGEIHHPLLNLPATDAKVRIEATYIDRIAGDKIVEEWERQDTMGVMQQLGFVPTPAKVAVRAEEDKAIVRRVIEEINKGEAAAMAAIDQSCSKDFILHSANSEEVLGVESYKRRVSDLYKAVPDVHFTIDDMVAEGDRVAARYTMTGTHAGELRHVVDLNATSKKVTASYIAIDRVTGGKFVEAWERFDTLSAMKQLGLVLVPSKT